MSINWGPWSEVGMAVSQAPAGHMGVITPGQGVEVLGRLLGASGMPQVAVLPLDLGKLAGTKAGHTPLFAELTGHTVDAPRAPAPAPAVAPSVAPPPAGILQQLGQAGLEARQELLEDYLKARTAEILEFPLSEVDVREPLTRMGIDSLMAVELRNHVEGDLNIVVELVAFLDGASLRDLAAGLLNDQLASGVEANGSSGDDRYGRAVRQVEQLSDEEVEALLAQGHERF